MTTNIVTPDGRRFNPARDLAHIWPNVVESAAAALEDGRLPGLDAWLKQHKVTMVELGEACGAQVRFLQAALSVEQAGQPFTAALRASGWHEVRWEAQVALAAYMGLVLSGSVFAAIRDANPHGDDEEAAEGRSVESVRTLRRAGEQLAAWQGLSPWRRWWLSRLSPLRRLWFATIGARGRR